MQKRKWTNEEIELYRKTHGNLFYFNKEDSNIFVPKPRPIGSYGASWTFNWANPIAWISILIIFGVVFWKKFFL